MYIQPQQYKKKKTLVWIFWIIAWLIMGTLFTVGWFYWQLIGVRGNAVENFVIDNGEGVNEISSNLYSAGVIHSKLVFETYIWLRNGERSLIAGTYHIAPSTIPQLTYTLRAGPGPKEVRVTLIEGWKLLDIAQALETSELTTQEEFMNIVQKPVANGLDAEAIPVLYSKPDSVDLEGYLFPDTYRFYKDADIKEVVAVLINTLAARITEPMAADIDAQGKTLHDILTMASIIEKEVRTDRDRRTVSGILWKRITKDIPLQVDSTVNYITGNNHPAVLLTDTKIDSPFNTYKHKGLPPGPIASPGLSAIMAAIYPTETEYLFYLSTPEGETIFSETFEQHVAAKNKYLK